MLSEPGSTVAYPVAVDVDDAPRSSRWLALFRLPLSLPVLLFTTLLNGGALMPMWVALLVTGRIPGWLFDFQVAVNRWQTRALSYALLLTDRYPSFEGAYAINYTVERAPSASRWKVVIWKLVTAVPHLVALLAMWISVVPITVVGWFFILVGGRYPGRLHRYVAGVVRWSARVQAYLQSLTDAFPPFALSSEAGAGSRRSYWASSVCGVAVTAGLAGLALTLLLTAGQHIERDVSYAALLSGTIDREGTRAEVHAGVAHLTAASDPASDAYSFLQAKGQHRLVEFEMTMRNWRDESAEDDVRFSDRQFSLLDDRGARSRAMLVVANGRPGPYSIDAGDSAIVRIVFELPDGRTPVELRFDVLNYIDIPRIGETIVWHLR
jgi:hypothetical protein